MFGQSHSSGGTHVASSYAVDGAFGFWEIARADPRRTAIVQEGGACITYGELLDLVNRLTHGLRAIDIGPHDVVAALMANEPMLLAVQLATDQLGVHFAPIDWHRGAPEVGRILKDCGAKLLIASDAYHAVAAEAADDAGLPSDMRIGTRRGGVLRAIDDLIRDQPTSTPEGRRAGQRLLYTSGTTGQPVGVKRRIGSLSPEDALAPTLAEYVSRFSMTAGSGSYLAATPLYYPFPNKCALFALHLGHCVVMADVWTPEGLLALIEQHRVTTVHMIPSTFLWLLKLPVETRRHYDVSSLTHVLHASAPCPVQVKKQMIEWFGPILHEVYAATEGGGTYVDSQNWIAHPGTVGRPWQGAAVKILDDDGREVPAGQLGTVYMKISMQGAFEYLNDPTKTLERQRGEYFTVGDIGYVDEDHWLYLSGRRSEVIVRCGVKIAPMEVENVLLRHRGVADAAVTGVPDGDWGERVIAIVEPLSDATAGAYFVDELFELCRAHLADVKWPSEILVRTVPRGPGGKVSKASVRDEYLRATASAPAEDRRTAPDS